MTPTKNNQVIVAMYRYNPQLGNYCTLSLADVVRVNKKTFVVNNGFYDRKFDFFGCEVNAKDAIYGRAFYRAYTIERAKELFDGEKFDGYRISGNNVLSTL